MYFKPWYSVPRVDQNIKYKEIKLEWFLIQLVLNRKTVVQQDRVKVLHDILLFYYYYKCKDYSDAIARTIQGHYTIVTELQ